MVRALTKLLVNRTKLALGSLSLVEKQLTEILYELDNNSENLYDETIRGEEENSDSDFFISPPLEVYEDHAFLAAADRTGETRGTD